MSFGAPISRRTWLVASCLTPLAGCTRSSEDHAADGTHATLDLTSGEKFDVPENVRRWPDVAYHDVRGYSFNFAGSPIARIFDKATGALDPSVREKAGVALSTEQVARLLKVVRNPEKVSWATGCMFTPRHAFVFYDAAQKPVAQLEVCFECYQIVAKPSLELSGTTIDYGELDKIFEELGIPGKLKREEYSRIAEADRLPPPTQ